MSMTDLSVLSQKFDLMYSSLAFHYVNDFVTFAKDMYSLLNSGGYLLFSQEHPLITATYGGEHHYNKDEKGNYLSFTFSDYGKPGRRDTFWYVDGVEKYHRRFSDIINALCAQGLLLTRFANPCPMKKQQKKYPLFWLKNKSNQPF